MALPQNTAGTCGTSFKILYNAYVDTPCHCFSL